MELGGGLVGNLLQGRLISGHLDHELGIHRFDQNRIGLSRAFLYLSIGPVLLTVLILVAYPETAHQTLEDLNPEDRGAGLEATARPSLPP